MEQGSYKAIVQRIFAVGRHGPYAKATSEELGNVTFSLTELVWNERRQPEEGELVVLSDVTKKRAGWRAQSGRFYRPSDEVKSQKTGEER
ncbi:MAG: hypothetical protein WAW92_02010 [Minisyncoccia bacterium]